jgi:hypothetical protein
MDLVTTRCWNSGMPSKEARSRRPLKTKRLCLIRRYIGKFLAEKELHETGHKIRTLLPEPRGATGFIYEPQGYLVTLSRFLWLDYLNGWAAAHVLRKFFELRFGENGLAG